jgi:hypothetical protein
MVAFDARLVLLRFVVYFQAHSFLKSFCYHHPKTRLDSFTRKAAGSDFPQFVQRAGHSCSVNGHTKVLKESRLCRNYLAQCVEVVF